ncbi:hypothetical protein DL96DRAFT_1827122 [Flagelloscypha sp. PMI_526]|nr:hypothetical protein DL96DRAFT_1827122 [Flagelloscypha sp. PMI_526]
MSHHCLQDLRSDKLRYCSRFLRPLIGVMLEMLRAVKSLFWVLFWEVYYGPLSPSLASILLRVLSSSLGYLEV